MTERRIVLVTGATRGLGAEAAAQLAADHLVLVGARRLSAAEARAEALSRAGGHARALALDVNDERSVAAAVRYIEENFGRLDVLINNAGVMLDGSWAGNTAAEAKQATLRETFETNFFAVVRLTQALLPLLRRGVDPHIINLSSVMGSNTIHADPKGPLTGFKPFAYDASKAALNAFTVHLAEAVAPHGIRVNSVHPGWVRTELGTDAAPLSVEEGARQIISLATSRGQAPSAKFLGPDGELPW